MSHDSEVVEQDDKEKTGGGEVWVHRRFQRSFFPSATTVVCSGEVLTRILLVLPFA